MLGQYIGNDDVFIFLKFKDYHFGYSRLFYMISLDILYGQSDLEYCYLLLMKLSSIYSTIVFLIVQIFYSLSIRDYLSFSVLKRIDYIWAF